MTIDKRLLRERKKMNKARPKFRRQESWRYKRLKKSWRKPVGIDNAMRHHKRGIPKIVRIGYRGPKAVRGLTSNGMQEVLVHNVNELEQLVKGVQIARIASTVGVKKKVAITNKADEIDIKIINRPEEALSFATLSDISEEFLLDEEDKKKSKSKKKPRKKKTTSTGLTEKEIEELERIESELKTGTKTRKTPTKPKTKAKPKTTKKPTPIKKTTTKKPTKTTKKTTTTKPKATTTKPKTTAKKTSSSTTTKKKTTTSSKKAADKKKSATSSKKK